MAKYKSSVNKYSKKIEDRAEKVLDVLALFVVGEAKLRVPVDTGNLKNSLTSEKEKLARGIGTNVKYARHVEQGTENQIAQPYLEPALTENKKELQLMFVRLMKQ